MLLLHATISKSATIWKLTHRFGGFMFFPLGLLDSSMMAPASMDALLIVLSAAHREMWWYYALMATAGSVTGAYPSYTLFQKGGEEALNKKLGKPRAEKVFRFFKKYGFWSVFLGCLAPPPFPTSGVIAAAGALQYPKSSFFTALSFGRLIRFYMIGWVAATYGRHISKFLGRYYMPALWTIIALAVAVGVGVLIYFRHTRRKKQAEAAGHMPEQNAV